jgi:hypothetical protein
MQGIGLVHLEVVNILADYVFPITLTNMFVTRLNKPFSRERWLGIEYPASHQSYV